MLRRWPVGFLCLCPPMKWWTKPLLSCLKSVIVAESILLNHTLAIPLNVVRNALRITSFGVICNNISVLNDLMWSKGSLELSYDSNCERQNFGGRGWFSTSVVNGESILQIIPSRFSPPLYFITLFSSSISFLMLRSSFSILVGFSLKVLSCLWLESLILLHFGFHLFANILSFGIPLSFTILHFGESALPH